MTNRLAPFLFVLLAILASCNSDIGSGVSGSKQVSGALSVKQQEVNNLNNFVSSENYKLSEEDLAYLQNEAVISKSKAKKLEKFQN